MTVSEAHEGKPLGGLVFSRREVLTWPNLFTLIRLCCIPVFVWLLFGPGNRAAAAWLLAGLGSTDWVDGWLARKLNQSTAFGALFDPTVDRLMFLIAVPAIVIDGSMPWVVATLAIAREAIVAVAAIVLGLKGIRPFEVTWEGKTGAFLLMFAFPMFLGAESSLSYAPVLSWLAWIFAIPGLGYSWYSLVVQYAPKIRNALAASNASPVD